MSTCVSLLSILRSEIEYAIHLKSSIFHLILENSFVYCKSMEIYQNLHLTLRIVKYFANLYISFKMQMLFRKPPHYKAAVTTIQKADYNFLFQISQMIR